MSAVCIFRWVPTLCPSRISISIEIRLRGNFLLSFATGLVRIMAAVAIVRWVPISFCQGHGCPPMISTPASIFCVAPVFTVHTTRQRAFLSPNCTPITLPSRSGFSSPESRAPRSLIFRVCACWENARSSAPKPNTRMSRSTWNRGSDLSDMEIGSTFYAG
jgi:hypothetical protein